MPATPASSHPTQEELNQQLLTRLQDDTESPEDLEALASAVEALLEKKANPNTKDEQSGDSPLLLALLQEQPENTVHTLLAAKADTNTVDNDNHPPLYHALGIEDDATRDTIVQQLLGATADPNQQYDGTSLLVDAINSDLPTVVDLLLQAKADPNTPSDTSEPPIVEATNTSQAKIVTALLDAGADPNTRDKNNTPVLHIEVQNGAADSAAALLSARANPNIKHNGLPPLYQLERTPDYSEEESQLIQLLQAQGATYAIDPDNPPAVIAYMLREQFPLASFGKALQIEGEFTIEASYLYCRQQYLEVVDLNFLSWLEQLTHLEQQFQTPGQQQPLTGKSFTYLRPFIIICAAFTNGNLESLGNIYPFLEPLFDAEDTDTEDMDTVPGSIWQDIHAFLNKSDAAAEDNKKTHEKNTFLDYSLHIIYLLTKQMLSSLSPTSQEDIALLQYLQYTLRQNNYNELLQNLIPKPPSKPRLLPVAKRFGISHKMLNLASNTIYNNEDLYPIKQLVDARCAFFQAVQGMWFPKLPAPMIQPSRHQSTRPKTPVEQRAFDRQYGIVPYTPPLSWHQPPLRFSWEQLFPRARQQKWFALPNPTARCWLRPATSQRAFDPALDDANPSTEETPKPV